MAAVFNDSKTNEKTKCAIKRINLDKGAENIQNIAQVRNYRDSPGASFICRQTDTTGRSSVYGNSENVGNFMNVRSQSPFYF